MKNPCSRPRSDFPFLALACLGACALACGMPTPPRGPDRLEIPRMTKVVVRNVSPGVTPDSPEAAPIAIYRLGNLYGRVEYGPERYVVVREPHAFLVDLQARKAWYAQDEGPSYVFRAPVVRDEALPGAPGPVRELEFGREPEFLKRHDVPSRGVERADGTRVLERRVDFEDYSVVVVTRPDSQAPMQVGVFQDGSLRVAFLYEEWRRDLLPAPAVFTLPDDVEIVEGPPPAGAEEAPGGAGHPQGGSGPP